MPNGPDRDPPELPEPPPDDGQRKRPLPEEPLPEEPLPDGGGLPEEHLPDEEGLPEEPLPDLGLLDARRPLPDDEELLDEEQPLAVDEAPRSVLPPLEDDPDALDTELPLEAEPPAGEPTGEGPDGVHLPDELATPAAWLADDGLARRDGEDDLVEIVPAPAPVRAPGGLPVAGVEELCWLVDHGVVTLTATLATGMDESVLSVPLTPLPDGRVRFQLGADEVDADPRGLSTRVRLGDLVLAVKLQIVDGPGPRLVLGRELLAGHLLVDPGRRFLLAPAVRPGARRRSAPDADRDED